MKTIIAAGGMLLALAGAGTAARAGDIIGGSSLLDDGREAQLERWLGAGEFNLNNVYTLRPGDTSVNFHQGADGKGATFTVMEVTNTAGQSFLVGGYNPQSWSSTDGWHETERDFQRTAFLFNFTTPAVYRQVLTDFELPSQGQRQTYNDILFGPVFGSGPDLFVNDDLTKALSWQLSYGNPANEGVSIIDGSLRGQTVSVNAMEIFAISPVPEPASWAMLLAGAGILGGMQSRRRRKSAPRLS
ncbi:MAG: PEP_CTERM-anchored TLD domain-containing protein [Telluria sp.]